MPRTTRGSPRSPKSRRDRSRGRQIAIVAGVGSLLGVALLLIQEVPTGNFVAPAPQVEIAANPTEDEIHTGSILYVPRDGRTCRQYLFDNNTGRLADNGTVDCERAAYHSTSRPSKSWSVARTHVISYSFRKH